MEDEKLNVELGQAIQEPIAEYLMPWGQGAVPWGNPGDAKVVMFLHPMAYAMVCQHGQSSTGVEVVGIFVGNAYFCPQMEKYYVIIEAAIPARLAQGARTQVVFEHEAWAEVLQEKETHYPERRIVGWYHTHPGFGAFFSPDDDFWHKHAFVNFWQVALVYDPVNNEASFFGWSGNRIELIAGFYELLGKGQKHSAIAKFGTTWEFRKSRERPPTTGERQRQPATGALVAAAEPAGGPAAAASDAGNPRLGTGGEVAAWMSHQASSHHEGAEATFRTAEGGWHWFLVVLRWGCFLVTAAIVVIFIIQIFNPGLLQPLWTWLAE